MENSLEAMTEKIIKGLMAGRPVYESCGLGPKDVEAIYSVGYTHYQVGRFEEAEALFRFATVMDCLDPKYGYALASTLQAERKFEEADRVYCVLASIDINNPAVYNGIAECRIARGDKSGAQDALEALIKAVKTDTPERKAAVDKAKRMIERLKS